MEFQKTSLCNRVIPAQRRKLDKILTLKLVKLSYLNLFTILIRCCFASYFCLSLFSILRGKTFLLGLIVDGATEHNMRKNRGNFENSFEFEYELEVFCLTETTFDAMKTGSVYSLKVSLIQISFLFYEKRTLR